MINITHLKNDFKQIFKNPIIVIMFVLPFIIAVVARLILTLLIPYLHQFIAIDATPYYSFILAAIMTEAPINLGIVTGFIMLDDRDGKIFELMRVTPLGASGYIINRLAFPAAASVFFTIAVYFIVNIYPLPAVTLILLSLLMGLIAVIIALVMFFIATDKVKGITYAKGLNMFSLFTLVDLLGLKWFSALSHAVPAYWITKIVQNPYNSLIIALAFVVCSVWVVGVLWVYRRKVG